MHSSSFGHLPAEHLAPDARVAYPNVLHVEVRDSQGDLWRIATQSAQFSPADPVQIIGQSIEEADIDDQTGELCCTLSDGSVLDIQPTPTESEDDPPHWELLGPSGIVLEFGPGMRWEISSSDALTSSRR